MEVSIKYIPSFVKNIFYRFATDKMFNKYAIFRWKQIICEIAKNSNIIDSKFIKNFSDSRTVNRIYYSMYYFNKEIILNIEDIVLALAMELHDINLDRIYNMKVNDEIYIENKYIVQFAIAIREYWIEELLENEILKRRLFKKTGVNVFGLKSEKEYDQEKLINLISNREKMIRTYYTSYSTLNKYDTVVRVFFPNEKGVVNHNIDSSIDVNVNSFLGFELGFYRLGYDYMLLDNYSFVKYVSYSKNKMREASVFQDIEIGQRSNKVIWVR